MRGFTRMAILGVLLSAFIAPGCVEQLLGLLPDDEWGDNHSFASAADITSRESEILDGVLLTSPEDYFKITTASDGIIFITCTPASGVSGGSDVAVALYDDTFTLVALGVPNDPLLEIIYDGGGSVALAGVYYILVEYTPPIGADTYLLTWLLL